MNTNSRVHTRVRYPLYRVRVVQLENTKYYFFFYVETCNRIFFKLIVQKVHRFRRTVSIIFCIKMCARIFFNGEYNLLFSKEQSSTLLKK